MASYDDSTGKHKAADAKARTAALSAIFILGICLGVVVAEKLYLNTEEAKTTPESLQSLRSKKLELLAAAKTNGGNSNLQVSGEPSLFVKGRKPRNELEKILQKVAPDGEVMIAISNMNLIRSESLRLWLNTAQRIPSKNWLVVAIDEELRDYCKENGINYYYRPVVVRIFLSFFF